MPPPSHHEQQSPTGPVTATEVDRMFRAAAAHGPWPERESCEGMAEFLSFLVVAPLSGTAIVRPPDSSLDPIDPGVSKRRRDAMNLLRAAISATREEMTGDWGWEVSARFMQPDAKVLADLEDALSAAEPLLCGEPVTPRGRRLRLWHRAGFLIANLALEILIADCGSRAKTVSRNTVAAKFTELALKRIGFPGAEREAIAANWAKFSK